MHPVMGIRLTGNRTPIHGLMTGPQYVCTSRGCPLPSEKTMAYRNSHVVRAASKITHLERLYNKNSSSTKASKRVSANK